MSLRDLVEGECGGSNSLVQLTSHFTNDRGLTESGINHPFQRIQNISNDLSAERCFDMRKLLENIQSVEKQSNDVSSSAVANNKEIVSSNHFENKNQNQRSSAPYPVSYYQPINQSFENYPLHSNINDENFLHYTNPYNETLTHEREWQYSQQLVNYNTDTAAQFGFLNNSNNELSYAAARLAHLMEKSPSFENSQFLGTVRELGKQYPINQFTKWAHEEIQVSNEGSTMRENDKLDEKNQVPSNQDSFSEKLWSDLTQKFEKLTDYENSWNLEDGAFLTPVHEYSFLEENPMIDSDDPLKEGKKRLNQGDLSGAILCFEAAVTKSKENVEGWLLLGKTQAENEQDPKAIAALKNCLKLDHSNLEALMAIAASFTNENYHYQACLALKDWLKYNSKYHYLVRNYENNNSNSEKSIPGISSIISQKFFSEMVDLYNKAIFQQSYDGSVDPDVQNGMGILLTLNNDHDKAAEYFKAAVTERNDPRLWNRLGATLANAQKPEQALEAYRNALTLSPGFIRARYNLGITCVHLNNYKEAVENLLIALNLQISGRGLQGEKSRSMSDSIWSTLRLAVSFYDKELLPLALQKNLDELNKVFNVNIKS